MYPVIRAKDRQKTIIQQCYRLQEVDGENAELEYLQFPKLAEMEQIQHLFTTRTGGVSTEHLASLNLSFSRGDLKEYVLENYRRIGLVMGCSIDRMVASHQTHTTNIRIVSEADAGKGIIAEKDYTDIDGLITNVPGIALACFYADCVPLYFVDPVKHVIGLAHSGWRGTVAGIGRGMVSRMQELYGCDPAHIVAAIGPSICQECYEVSEEVAEEFWTGFWVEENIRTFCQEIRTSGIYPEVELLIPGKEPGKYQLDLWLANLIVLRSAGIRFDNIDITDVCTCCNPEYLFSHRASKGMRGNLAAFLMIKP